jgi:hypothetical protein
VNEQILLVGLHHAAPALAHAEHQRHDVRLLGSLQKTPGVVNGNEGAGATNASRAVNDNWPTNSSTST